jgi:hypothetical protein
VPAFGPQKKHKQMSWDSSWGDEHRRLDDEVEKSGDLAAAKEMAAAQLLPGMVPSQVRPSLSIFPGYEWEEKVRGRTHCWKRSTLYADG